jgi:apolipoprotein N-acyltransferase
MSLSDVDWSVFALGVALFFSITISLVCWLRILRSSDPAWFKSILCLIASVPFLGPVFYFLTELPDRLPKDAQASGQWMWGMTPKEEILRELYEGNKKLVDDSVARASRLSPKVNVSKTKKRPDKKRKA